MKPVPATIALATVILTLGSFANSQAVKPCRANQLTVVVRGLAGEAGHEADMVRVTNKSGSSCSVNGMPNLTFLGAGGRQVPLSVCANCASVLFTPEPPDDIMLNTSDSAHFFLGYVSAISNGSTCRVAVRAQVFFGRDPVPIALFHKYNPTGDLSSTESDSICDPDISGWRRGVFQRGETRYRVMATLHARP